MEEQLNKQEISIVYGKEIQLTVSNDKKKEVYVKFSTTFRKRQLKELKGVKLSVFLCYALHSDENGYCWIDNKLVQKETGYGENQIMEAKQFLRYKGYLFYERLYNEKGQMKDWIYRIFQSIEEGKIWVIRNEEVHTLTSKKPYLGENPNLGKMGGVIEEKPINIKEEPITVSKTNKDYNYQNSLSLMEQDRNKHIQVIALYWKYKNYNLENPEQYNSALRRDLRSARQLIGYSKDKLLEVMDWLESNTDIKWTLETVNKFVNEDLDNIGSMRKNGIR